MYFKILKYLQIPISNSYQNINQKKEYQKFDCTNYVKHSIDDPIDKNKWF